jgi:hypothetical protein
MTLDARLKNLIREIMEEELDEMTTTGDVAGYLVPSAFRGDKSAAKRKTKHISTLQGYSLTKRGEEEAERDGDKLEEGVRYHEYKKDESATPHKKIAKAISELNRGLNEMERSLKMNARLQTESGISSEELWKRTQKGLLKLESRLLHMAGKVRNIRGS